MERDYYPGLSAFNVWVGCLFGVALVAFVLRPKLRHSQEPGQPSVASGCNCHLMGRTAPVASGQLNYPAASSEEITFSSSAPEATSRTRGQRGRQFPSQGLNIPPLNKPFLSTALQAYLHLQSPENESKQRHFLDPTVKVPAGLKRVKIRSKDRFIPYSDIRRRHRGSTLGAVQARQSERKSPLEIALFGKLDLQPDTIIWFILIVAVDDPGRDLQDPKHDLEFWRKMLNDPALDSEFIYFIELAGKDATPETIKDGFARLYRDSEALVTVGCPNLFVYLTGEGDADQNRMHLLDGEFLSADDINLWLSELRISCRYTRPITIVLDICRTNKDIPSAKMHSGVELIYSSSPGEKAHALRFESERDTPYSSFMLALVITSFISLTSATEFVATLEQWLKQLTELIRSRASEKGDEDPGPQNPDWSQANDLSTCIMLSRMLSRTAAVHEVYDFITQKGNEDPGDKSPLKTPVVRKVYDYITQMPYFYKETIAPQLGPPPDDRTTHHLRGTSKNVPTIQAGS
ncbi:unnamed protein product [Rhizoctonia solani]|uniref:Caspase domain-containing protein n=1 Tax=Rhizoctonia solani TaxID=456999 RepID=A0A8H3DU54_9AGAM|nr:unnamed protein product [Rhizoctonia solani]